MNQFIYGEWRGKPAREDRVTGLRYWYEDGKWLGPLAYGYNTEFKAFAEQQPADAWEAKHHS